MEKMAQVAMQIIMHAGNSRSLSMESIQAIREGDVDKSNQLINESEEALTDAHQMQTDLLVQEARGEKVDIGLLLIHSQDHLMTAITVKDLAKEIILLYKKDIES